MTMLFSNYQDTTKEHDRRCILNTYILILKATSQYHTTIASCEMAKRKIICFDKSKECASLELLKRSPLKLYIIILNY